MNYLRVVFCLLLVWAGALAVLYEPDWVTYAVLGGGAAVLLITLLLERYITRGLVVGAIK